MWTRHGDKRRVMALTAEQTKKLKLCKSCKARMKKDECKYVFTPGSDIYHLVTRKNFNEANRDFEDAYRARQGWRTYCDRNFDLRD